MIDLLRQIQTVISHMEFSLTLHAQQQITTRRIKVSEIREALLSAHADVIEDYPQDPRGASCLVYGETANRVLHVHISYPPEIVVITVYEPDPARWAADLKARK